MARLEIGNKAVEIAVVFGKTNEATERVNLTSAATPALLLTMAELVFLQGDPAGVLMQLREVDLQRFIAVKPLECSEPRASAAE